MFRAIGAILYEMCEQKLAFNGNETTIMDKVLNGPTPLVNTEGRIANLKWQARFNVIYLYGGPSYPLNNLRYLRFKGFSLKVTLKYMLNILSCLLQGMKRKMKIQAHPLEPLSGQNDVGKSVPWLP